MAEMRVVSRPLLVIHSAWVDADLSLEELGLLVWVGVHGPVSEDYIQEQHPGVRYDKLAELMPADLMKPPRKKRPKPKKKRTRSQDQIDRAELEEYFSELAGIAKPNPSTGRQRNQAVALWWNPLREIYNLCENDVDEAKSLIREALAQMAELTIASPKSILKTCISIAARQERDDGLAF